MAIYRSSPCHAAPENHVSQQSDTNQTEMSYTTQCHRPCYVSNIGLGPAALVLYSLWHCQMPACTETPFLYVTALVENYQNKSTKKTTPEGIVVHIQIYYSETIVPILFCFIMRSLTCNISPSSTSFTSSIPQKVCSKNHSPVNQLTKGN